MELEDALKTLIQGLRQTPRAYAQYGYGVYIPRLVESVLDAQGITRLDERHREAQKFVDGQPLASVNRKAVA